MADKNQRHKDPIDRAGEILQDHQRDRERESLGKATEILDASRTGRVSSPVAEAVSGGHPVGRRRNGGWWPIDPMIVTIILLSIAVGTLAVIVALQASATSDRAAANQNKLAVLSGNVAGLANQLKAIEKNDLAKDSLNRALLEQNTKFRAYLEKHHINPNGIAGPAPKIPPALLGMTSPKHSSSASKSSRVKGASAPGRRFPGASQVAIGLTPTNPTSPARTPARPSPAPSQTSSPAPSPTGAPTPRPTAPAPQPTPQPAPIISVPIKLPPLPPLPVVSLPGLLK